MDRQQRTSSLMVRAATGPLSLLMLAGCGSQTDSPATAPRLLQVDDARPAQMAADTGGSEARLVGVDSSQDRPIWTRLVRLPPVDEEVASPVDLSAPTSSPMAPGFVPLPAPSARSLSVGPTYNAEIAVRPGRSMKLPEILGADGRPMDKDGAASDAPLETRMVGGALQVVNRHVENAAEMVDSSRVESLVDQTEADGPRTVYNKFAEEAAEEVAQEAADQAAREAVDQLAREAAAKAAQEARAAREAAEQAAREAFVAEAAAPAVTEAVEPRSGSAAPAGNILGLLPPSQNEAPAPLSPRDVGSRYADAGAPDATLPLAEAPLAEAPLAEAPQAVVAPAPAAPALPANAPTAEVDYRPMPLPGQAHGVAATEPSYTPSQLRFAEADDKLAPPQQPEPTVAPSHVAPHAGATVPSLMAARPETVMAGPAAAPAYDPAMRAVAERAAEKIRRGMSLAQRGALHSGRSEFLQALRLTTQALDSREGGSRHSKALSAGMRALREANDFVPRGNGLEADIDVAAQASGHRTPILRDSAGAKLTPLLARQRYYTYAREQLALAAGNERAGSMALYSLGRMQTALAAENPTRDSSAPFKAMALHQAALQSDGANYMAANELGVLLARFGEYEQARVMLDHSVQLSSQTTTLNNLATVYDRLGNKGEAQQLRHRAASGKLNPVVASRRQVEWIDAAEFARSSQAYGGGAVSPGVASLNPPQPQAAPAVQPAPQRSGFDVRTVMDRMLNPTRRRR